VRRSEMPRSGGKTTRERGRAQGAMTKHNRSAEGGCKAWWAEPEYGTVEECSRGPFREH